MDDKLTLVQEIHQQLLASVSMAPEHAKMFFKTGEGSYAQHDQFLGIKVPVIRALAQQYAQVNFDVLQALLESPFNEERLFALVVLAEQYKKATEYNKQKIYDFYVANMQHVNNWNLVDSSAHLIVGAHLSDKDHSVLCQWAQSEDLWQRRIAIVATWYFIRHTELDSTFKIAQILLHDKHDLIHKAVGWMLREAGKRDQGALMQFLDEHAVVMPRTMLRYAIEKFPVDIRKKFMARG